MNTQNQIKTVAISAIIALLSIGGLVSTVQAQEAYIPYGTQVNNDIAYEDKPYVILNDEHVYINVVPTQGNRQFALTDLETDYTVDEMIDRFGLEEDTNSFVVEPFNNISNVGIVYQFNDETLTFQLIGAVEV